LNKKNKRKLSKKTKTRKMMFLNTEAKMKEEMKKEVARRKLVLNPMDLQFLLRSF